MLRNGLIWIISLAGFFALAEDESVKPAVEKIGESRYRLGKIEFDAATREVSIPVTVNMREGGPLEYVLVHETGKVHESVFVTEVSPRDLQVVMKMVKYDDGQGDVFNALLPAADLAKEGGRKADRGTRVAFTFVVDAGEEIAVEETVWDGFGGVPLSDANWVFTGSEFHEGGFMAEVEGSIIAIYLDQAAMFNMTHPGADTDERWGANDKVIPEIGAKGTLLILPGGADQPSKKDTSDVSR